MAKAFSYNFNVNATKTATIITGKIHNINLPKTTTTIHYSYNDKVHRLLFASRSPPLIAFTAMPDKRLKQRTCHLITTRLLMTLHWQFACN